MSDGSTSETGIIGNRGVLGVNAFMGGRETTQTKYIVQIAGSAMKIDAQTLRSEFDRNKKLRDVLLPYTQALIAQISQTTACNRLHALEQRFARWLLEAQSRVEKDELQLTLEFPRDMPRWCHRGCPKASGEPYYPLSAEVTLISSTKKDWKRHPASASEPLEMNTLACLD